MRFILTKYYVILFILLFNAPLTRAQITNSDSLKQSAIYQSDTSSVLISSQHTITGKADTITIKKHSPRKAAWMSATLPGLGQIYNRKYWKLPIIYVGFGVIGYLGYNYYTKFNHYKSSYLVRKGIDVSKTDYYPDISNPDLLYSNFSYYRRNFELTCIFGSLFYVLNIIDASVDAHLYKFDISEDLSMRIEPDLIYYQYTSFNNPSTGLKISLNF